MAIHELGLQIIIPAAGASSRLGQAKQLVQNGSGTLIDQTLALALTLNQPVSLITGHWRPRQPLPTGISELYFPNWAQGMGASIAYGVAKTAVPTHGYLVLLSDQWGLTATALASFIDQWDGQQSQVASDQNYLGPPVLFPVQLREPLCQLTGDQGAKTILKQQPFTTVFLPNAALDLDTPEQLATFKLKNNEKNQKEPQHDFN